MINMGVGLAIVALIAFPALVTFRRHWQAWWVYGCICVLSALGFIGSALGWDQ